MNGCIRHVSAEVHAFEVAFFRNLFGLVALSPLLVRAGSAGLRTSQLGLHAVRGLLTDCNVIDEVFIASDAGRSSAGIGHYKPAARGIIVADQRKELVTGKRRPPIPVTKDCEVLPRSRACIDPIFNHRQLLKQD